jgi:uncharacterized protein DUF5752
MRAPFELDGVVHLLRPTGRVAHHLDALRDGIAATSAPSLFHHAFGARLRLPRGSETPPDDFSAWVNGVVQDRETAERLAFAIDERGGSAGELRAALIEVLERIPEKARVSRDAPEEGDFVFLEMDSVLVPTGTMVHHCGELMPLLAEAHPSVLFYHLIEQPWLEPGRPSLAEWVEECGAPRLAEWLRQAMGSGQSIEESRRRLARRWRQSGLGRRVAEAAGRPEPERRETARRAVAGLVRRITRAEDPDDSRPGA